MAATATVKAAATNVEPAKQAGPREVGDVALGPAECPERIGEGFVAAAGNALGTELRSCVGRGRCAADHLAGLGKLEQAVQSISGHLQLIAAHAATLWNWDAETVCGPGESLFGRHLLLPGWSITTPTAAFNAPLAAAIVRL